MPAVSPMTPNVRHSGRLSEQGSMNERPKHQKRPPVRHAYRPGRFVSAQEIVGSYHQEVVDGPCGERKSR
jgi:hypothetical protein